MVLAFRREACAESTLHVALKGLDADATYLVGQRADDEERTCSGRELMEGLDIAVNDAPGSALLRYRLSSS